MRFRSSPDLQGKSASTVADQVSQGWNRTRAENKAIPPGDIGPGLAPLQVFRGANEYFYSDYLRKWATDVGAAEKTLVVKEEPWDAVRAALGRFFGAAVADVPVRGHSSDDDGKPWGFPREMEPLRAYFAEDWDRVDTVVAELGFRTVASVLAAPKGSAAGR